MEESKIILGEMVSALVINREAVKIETSTDERGVLLTVFVDSNDMGRVIGKAGATAQALRTIVKAVGGTYKARVSVTFHDPNPQFRKPVQRERDVDLVG